MLTSTHAPTEGKDEAAKEDFYSEFDVHRSVHRNMFL